MIHMIKRAVTFMDKNTKRHIVFLGMVIILYSVASIAPVYYIQKIIDSIDILHSTKAIHHILFYGILYLGMQTAAQFLGAVSNLIAEKTQTQFGSDLQVRLYYNFLHSNLCGQENSTVLANRLIEDTQYISSNLFSSLQIMFMAVLTFFVGVFFMVRINGYLTLIILPLGLITALTSRLIERRAERYAEEKRKAQEALWKCFSQGILGAFTLKIYDQKGAYLSMISDSSCKVKEISYRQSRMENLSAFVVGSLYMMTIGCIMICSAIFVTKGMISIGGLTALMMYNHMLVDPLMNLLDCRQKLVKSKVSMQRIDDVLMVQTQERVISSHKIDHIVFEKVSFRYADSSPTVLDEASFTLQAGKKYLIRGRSGIGKTTLVNLMTGFLMPKEGNIFYLSDHMKMDAFPDIGYLMQDGFLFDDSIKENIRIAAPKIAQEDVDALIEDCGLHDVYARMNEAPIGENGNLLSGGERKRLLLAQTLARSKCDMFIFDELSSSLDVSTYRRICERIQPYLRDKICIFIEHSQQDFIHCDYAFSIQDGKTVLIACSK